MSIGTCNDLAFDDDDDEDNDISASLPAVSSQVQKYVNMKKVEDRHFENKSQLDDTSSLGTYLVRHA